MAFFKIVPILLLVTSVSMANPLCVGYFQSEPLKPAPAVFSVKSDQGPIATNLLDMFQMNPKDVLRSIERLNTEDKQAIEKQLTKDIVLVKALEGAKMSAEDTAIWIKKLMKANVIFSKFHIEKFEHAFFEHFLRSWRGNPAKRQTLISFRKSLSSSNPTDKAVVEEFTDLLVSNFFAHLKIENYEWLDTIQKESKLKAVAEKLFPGTFKRKADQAVRLDQIEELQKFFNLPAAKGLLRAIIFRSMEESVNIFEDSIPTWKTYLGKAAMFSGLLSLVALGPVVQALMVPLAVPTGIAVGGGPVIARHFSMKKNFKKMKSRENDLVDNYVSQRGIETVAAEVARDEAREDKADFQFGIIMKEIKEGLSVSEFYKLSQWGSGFDRGFVNIVDRHNSLKNRLELIARELDPVLTELKNGSPDLSRLKSLQRLVEISGPQAQNLLIDINFLKTDYLAMGIALDRYILDLDALSKDPDLLDRQRDQINRRRERLEMRKKNLETSAFALGPILALHESVIVSLEDYQDIISMDMSEKLRQ